MSQQFEEYVRQIAHVTGAVVVEAFVCPACRQSQLSAHLWCETLKCKDPSCGGRLPSKVSRPPQPGEVSLETLELAMKTLRETYEKQQVVELPPLTPTEVAELPVAVKLLLARQSVAASQHVLVKAAALAEEMAALHGKPEHQG